MLAAVLASVALVTFQAAGPQGARPAPGAPGTAAEKAPTDPRDRPLSDFATPAAQELVVAYHANVTAKASADDRVAGLRKLVQGRHKLICDEVLKAVKDPDANVRLEAVKLLGTQPCDQSRAALFQFCRTAKSLDVALGPEAIRSLGYIGYGAKGPKPLVDLFYATKCAAARKAIVQAIGRQKDKAGISLIVVLLDPPRPKDPNDAANPPAQFWTEKNDEWVTYKDDVYQAFEAITGRKFFSTGPAAEWIEKDGKKLGLKVDALKSPWLG